VQPRSQATIVQAVTQQVKRLRKQSVRSVVSVATQTAMADSAQPKLALNIFPESRPFRAAFLFMAARWVSVCVMAWKNILCLLEGQGRSS